MDNEEYVSAQQVIAGSTTTLAVQALREANDELQSEVIFLKEEITRLRRAVRATRTERRKISSNVQDLIKQVEDMGAHIFDIAAQEAEIDEHGFIDRESSTLCVPGSVFGSDTPYAYDEQEKAARDKQKAEEEFTRGWVDRMYQEMRTSGEYPVTFPLSPAEVYAAAQTGITAALAAANISDNTQPA